MSDINKLTEILNRSKAVMQKTDTEYGSVGSSNPTPQQQSFEEKETPNLTENYINKHSNGATKSVAPKSGQYRNIKTSKMPQAVLNAMVEEPIEIPESPYPTFELDHVEDLVNETPQPQPTQFTPPNPTNIDVNNVRQIVREEIEDVVREVIEEYLDKSLVTEDIKIKIGNTIFGGKLKPLPTKKKTKKRV